MYIITATIFTPLSCMEGSGLGKAAWTVWDSHEWWLWSPVCRPVRLHVPAILKKTEYFGKQGIREDDAAQILWTCRRIHGFLWMSGF